MALPSVEELCAPVREDWVDVPGWSGNYEVNVRGVIRNKKTKLIRKQHADVEGYMKVTLCNGRPCKPPVRVHRIVAQAFLGDAPEGMNEVNHIDGDRANNAAWNLEWCSNADNIQHSMNVNGRRKKIAERRRANGQFGKPQEKGK